MSTPGASALEHIPEGEAVQTEFTLDQFLDHNLEEPPYLEYEGKGRVRRKMSPNTEHAAIAAELSHRFLAYRDRTQRELHVYVELRTNVDDRSVLPDVAVYVGRRPAENQRKQALVVADVSIEIISPRQNRERQESKCQWYLQQGGTFAMLIDPNKRDVTVYARALETNTMGAIGHYVENAPATEPINEFDKLLPDLNLSAAVIFAVLK